MSKQQVTISILCSPFLILGTLALSMFVAAYGIVVFSKYRSLYV